MLLRFMTFVFVGLIEFLTTSVRVMLKPGTRIYYYGQAYYRHLWTSQDGRYATPYHNTFNYK